MEAMFEILRRLGPAAWLAGAAAVLPAVNGFLLLAYINQVGMWLRDHGTRGVVVYSAGFMVLAGLALLPTYASAILGGWAFGFATGFPAALCGFVGGSLIGYAVARPTAAGRVESLLTEKPKWRVVRDALVGSGAWRALLIVTLVRVPPNSPFALTNLVLASVRVPLWTYLVGTAIGMAPRTAAAVYLASQVRGLTAEEAKDQRPGWWVPVGIGLTLAVLWIVGTMATHALRRVTAEGAGGTAAPNAE